jgi:tetratricopeptide (TPR) repeat protein
VFPRYPYLHPAKSATGNRAKAEPLFVHGLQAHRAGDVYQALSDYQRATRQDPAYFEAWYNQGLASYEVGKWTQSLHAYEAALALKPDSIDARYNFALALKQGGFAQDAVDELGRIVERQPGEARAHLSLANLYAYYLLKPKLAREQFTKVLELQPEHPQAEDIKLWLGTQAQGEE